MCIHTQLQSIPQAVPVDLLGYRQVPEVGIDSNISHSFYTTSKNNDITLSESYTVSLT